MEKSDEYDSNDFDLWKSSITGGNIVLSKRKYPKVRASYDMGWQQRGSGSSYSSQSGHALYVGAEMQKPISFDIKSKLCSVCNTIRGKEGPVKEHDCCKNWTGTSSAMEAKAALDMYVDLYENHNTTVALIVADDGASTRAILQWDNADYLRNNNTNVLPQVPKKTGKNKGELQNRPDGVGKLPGHVPQPRFAADPNHRRKLLSGELRALEKLKVSERMTLTLMDVKRIDKNYGHFLKQCPSMSEEERSDAAKAVLEHHFDNHEHCRSWCSRKLLTEEQRKKGKQYYHCKQKDAKLYQKLQAIISRFITKECLDDLCHGMNTQVNESFNNTFSWYAPKNKVHCGTWSLQNRLGIPIGIHSVGFDAYYRHLLTKLGIQITPDLRHFLTVKDRYRLKRLAKIRTVAYRRKKIQHEIDSLKKETASAHKERAKQEGQYRRSMNFELGPTGGWTEDDITRPKKKGRRSNVKCPRCNKYGHSTARSKDCDFYVPPKQKRGESQVTAAAEEELAELDAIPLDDDDDLDMFHEAGTWTSDDDSDNSVQQLGML